MREMKDRENKTILEGGITNNYNLGLVESEAERMIDRELER